MSMLFHLDKCIGCHTCSIACKNLWTDRKGAEYMWWNNVETRPGAGYPTQWETRYTTKVVGKRRTATCACVCIPEPKGWPISSSILAASLEDYYEPFTSGIKTCSMPLQVLTSRQPSLSR